jgi:hypothetical protein
MSTGIHGYGAVLKLGTDGVSSNATSVANITSISGPNMTRDSVDISTLTSASITKEFVPGLIDPGEITLEINYNETDAALLTGTTVGINNHYPIYIAMNFPDATATAASGTVGSSFEGMGFITSLGHALDTGSKISQSCTIKLTGALTYTTSAAT